MYNTDFDKPLEEKLFKEISNLRNGYGCRSKISDAVELTDLMNCIVPSHDYMASCFLTVIQTLMSGPEGEVLLAVFNLLEGYEHLSSANERRLKYHQDCFPNDTNINMDTLYRQENSSIRVLVDKIINNSVTGALDVLLSNTPENLHIPKPQYTVISANTQTSTNTGTDIKEQLDEQMVTLSELKTMHDESHSDIKGISEQTKNTPTIAVGVSEANIKLDELLELSSRMDRLDDIADSQAKAGLNAFVHSLIGDQITKMNPIEYEQLAQIIKSEVWDQLYRAVLNRLPDDALAEIERHIDDNPNDLAFLIQYKATEYNLDVDTIVFDTLARFAEFFKSTQPQEDCIITEATETKVLPEQKIIEATSPLETKPDIASMPDSFVDEWLEELLKPY